MSPNSTTAMLSPELILESIARVTLQIQQSRDLDDLLQWAIADARTLLQTDRVLLYRFLPDQDAVIACESVGAEWTPLLGQQIYDPCFAATWVERYQKGQTTTIANIHDGTVDPCYVQLLERLQVQANLVVPILSRGRLWGLLIAHHCRSPREWTAAVVQLLQHYALQLGVAVQLAALPQRQPLDRQLELPTMDFDQAAIAAARHDSEAKYHHLVEHLNAGFVVHAPDTRVLQCNATACTLLGLTRAQLLGKAALDPAWQFQREDGSVMPLEEYPVQRVLATQAPLQNYVVGIKRGKQSQCWVLVAAFPEFESQGTLLQVVVTFIDISRLKQAERALQWQAGQRRLLAAITQQIRQTLDLDDILQTTVTTVRQFLQTDRVLVYRFDPDWSGNVIAEAVAAGWPSILGVPITDTYFVETQGNAYAQGRMVAIEDIYQAAFTPCHVEWLEQMHVRAKLVVPILQGDHLWGLLVAQHCQAPRPWSTLERELLQQLALQLAIALQQAELYQQVQTLNHDLEVQVQSRTDQLQQALDFESLLKSITDRVRDSLDEQYILPTAVEALAHGLAVAACDAGLYNAAQTTSTIAYECTRSLTALQGLTFALATAPHPEIYPFLLRGQTCQFCDVSPSPLRPEQQLLTTLAVPLVDDQRVLGDLWLFKPAEAVFTEREMRLVQQVANQCAIALRQSRLYQAAQSQLQELERLNQLKDDFLSTVSHELRTPMANIKMATQMLEISLHRLGLLEDDSQSIRRYFNILRDEGQRELALINDLLDLTRLDAEVEPLPLTTIDLQFYLRHLTEAFSERTQQQQQQLVIQVPDHLPPLTTALPELERLLTELLHNACKYTPAGETITLSAQSTAKGLALRVSNTGIEISPTEREHIFDKFYRIPHHDPWKHGGTGLGLALVKKLTARLGGQIAVDSGGGQTTFRLELRVPPLAAAAAATAP